MKAHPDFDAVRASIVEAADRGDSESVRAAIRPAARTFASEHGTRFRALIAGLPIEIWHNDPEVAAAMGASYRSNGSPRGQSALGYFRAAEDAIAVTPGVPDHCLAAVLVGHTAALRSLGQIGQARLKSQAAFEVIQTRLVATMPQRIALGARWSLEAGMLHVHAGALDLARRHLQYAHGLASVHLTRAEQIECLGGLAIIDGSAGDLEGALEHVEHAKGLAEGTDLMQTGYGAPAWAAEVMIANERLDLERAAAIETSMLDAASRNEWEPFTLVISAQLRALERHPIVALDVLNRARKGYDDWDETGIGYDFAELLRAGLMLGLDHSETAWTILQEQRPYDTHPLCPARITAQLRLRHGDLLGAHEALHECEELGETHCARTLVEIQLLRAAIELERGNMSGSDVNADRAFVTMARTGARAPLQRIPAASLSALAQRAVQRHQMPEVARMLARVVESTAGPQREVEPLSARERLVLAEVQRGFTVAAIASELYISPNTVKTHLRRLYRKLGVSTREEAIRAARSLGLDREITRSSPVSPTDSPESTVL